MENTERQDSRLKTIWNRMMNLKGDKVILIIIILLILISFLAIFSSTPLLPSQSSRLATMKEHGFIVFLVVYTCVGEHTDGEERDAKAVA